MKGRGDMKVSVDYMEVLDSHLKNKLSLDQTPNISYAFADIPSVRFSRDSLIQELMKFHRKSKNAPIEAYEVELFKATRMFHDDLQGIALSMQCLEKLHHIHKLSHGNYVLTESQQSLLKFKIDSLIKAYPLISTEYTLFSKVLEIANGLLVKWKISDINSYDYRYSGRGLNVSMLDLNEINKSLMSIDII